MTTELAFTDPSNENFFVFFVWFNKKSFTKNIKWKNKNYFCFSEKWNDWYFCDTFWSAWCDDINHTFYVI